MRKSIWALALTGALMMGMPAFAEDAGAASGAGVGMEDAASAAQAGSGMGIGYAASVTGIGPSGVMASAKAHEIGDVGAFLDAMDLGNHIRYVPYPLGEKDKENPQAKSPVGQLQVKRDGLLMTADVVNGSMPKDSDGGKLLEGLFDRDKEGNPAAEGTFKVMLFNQMLEKAPAVVNQKLLDLVGEARKRTGEPIPFSIAHIEFRGVEALHLVKTDRMVYTTGARVFVYFDGWVIPLYVKGYVWKHEDTYRFVGVWSTDSQKEAALEGAGALMEQVIKGNL